LQDREAEIRALREELKVVRAQAEEGLQMAQARQAEVQEMVEDIQTLTRENKYVN
jgi:hypothetical protein